MMLITTSSYMLIQKDKLTVELNQGNRTHLCRDRLLAASFVRRANLLVLCWVG